MAQNIVILGAGFGGLRCALDLARKVSSEWQVILIDRQDYHVHMPLLYEVATAYFGTHEPTEPELRACCGLDLKKILPKSVEFVQGEVKGMDCRKKKVLVGKEAIEYDYLALALGSSPDFFGIPGLENHAYTFATVHDAIAVRRKIRDLIEEVRAGHLERADFAVGGGGATGVEFAAELAHLLRRELKTAQWSITLIEASSRVLGMLPLRASQYAHSRLEKLGVRIMADTCIKKVKGEKGVVEVVLVPRPLKPGEPESVLVCEFLSKKEKRVSTNMLIWAGGIRANTLTAQCGLPTNRKGRLEVNEHLQVKGLENVFAIGDNALLLDPRTNQPVPALAQAAIVQGQMVAKNIARAIGGQPLALYPFPQFPTVLPLGGKSALVVWGAVAFNGLLGWLVRQGADLRYFVSIMPWWRALRLFCQGLRVYTKND